ncbi:ATP-binding protein [Leucobacter japonicus]|uniref:ATP-binding protein n=1 Tax=Leucobacter japonicus TaxID=1461259 RepID=UPI000949552B|nr:ATP-binding protein [Leucobacter japonicus]
MYSFEDILSEIETKKSSAKTQAGSWERLREVVLELAGVPSSSRIWPSADGKWALEKVSIQSFRGVTNEEPLVLTFEPTPGITVLHGLNGAGKSSISDAIEVALTGRTPSLSVGTAGKAALWDPIHLSQGAGGACVEVTLACAGQRLVLTATLDEGGKVQEHWGELIVDGSSSRIDLDSSWHQALISHQPVFAYATLERRVQLSKDLATYFDGLLALGGSFAVLHNTITERATASMEAHTRWQTAKVSAMRMISEIDTDCARANPGISLTSIPDPTPGDDIDEWLENAGLVQEGQVTSPLPADSGVRLEAVASECARAINSYEEGRSAPEQGLSAALQFLYQETSSLDIQSRNCPVCLTVNTDWIDALRLTVESDAKLTRLRGGMEAAIRSLMQSANSILIPAIHVAEGTASTDPIRNSAQEAGGLVAELAGGLERGLPSQHAVVRSAGNLAKWLSSDDGRGLLQDAIARTDVIKQWRLARARAVEDFAAIWRTDGVLASASLEWKEVAKRVDDLRNHLRKKRSGVLESLAGSRIESLLLDADLHLNRISVLSTKANMELSDQSGNKVELGMLSAGQRNAVLLAPLLASIDAGPFGFLVLDDPVHAFDELRIDRLAESLAEIARSRRVIVLTHDERLKEYLAAKASDCDTRLVERSNGEGSVSVSNSSHFWAELLDDAGHMHDVARLEVGSTHEISGTLRGLCRMAIDNALRVFTLRNAVGSARDAVADLQLLDEAYITRMRLTLASGFWEGDPWRNPVDKAAEATESYMDSWNQAVHGNPPTSDFTREEIAAARRACRALVGMA